MTELSEKGVHWLGYKTTQQNVTGTFTITDWTETANVGNSSTITLDSTGGTNASLKVTIPGLYLVVVELGAASVATYDDMAMYIIKGSAFVAGMPTYGKIRHNGSTPAEYQLSTSALIPVDKDDLLTVIVYKNGAGVIPLSTDPSRTGKFSIVLISKF